MPTTSRSDARREKSGVIDALDFAELSDVLRRFRKQYGSEAKLDIIAFDACELATVELSYQLSPFATFLLGSQVGIPIPGWPYDPHIGPPAVSEGGDHGPTRVRCVRSETIL